MLLEENACCHVFLLLELLLVVIPDDACCVRDASGTTPPDPLLLLLLLFTCDVSFVVFALLLGGNDFAFVVGAASPEGLRFDVVVVMVDDDDVAPLSGTGELSDAVVRWLIMGTGLRDVGDMVPR